MHSDCLTCNSQIDKTMIANFKNYYELSAFAAGEIMKLVRDNNKAVLCLAAGDTPALTYEIVVKEATQNSIDFSGVTFIGLDEWVGIGPDTPGSCYHFLQQKIFVPLAIQKEQIHFFDALADDLEQECGRMNEVIQSRGKINLALVGIGLNGHIGFNEPGVDPLLNAHVVALDEITSSTGQKYFKRTAVLAKGITLGIAQLMAADEILLLASGTKKAAIIRRTLKEDISNAVPASFITAHSHGLILLDKEAGALL